MCKFRQQARNFVTQLASIDNHVDGAMIEQKFTALESFRKLLSDCLLNDPRTGKADQRLGLRNIDIPKHREACRDPTSGRIG